MRNITYKYNRGDRVCFKDKYPQSASCGLLERVGTTAVIAERSDYNGPSYKLVGVRGWFKESCFAGLATEPVGSTCRDEVAGADAFQGPETECDVDDSSESESKWYRISFSAKLSADDLRAMKKCFFDAMNESMEIYDLENLVIEEA